MKFCKLLVFVALAGAILTSAAFSQGPAPLRIQTDYITGLSLPLYVTNAKDGSYRLFIVQQRGIIKVVQPGSRTPTDFLNVSSVVSQTGSERGLLGLAFHPQYASNGRFFIYYTRQSDGSLEIAEYAASASDPNVANQNAVRVIITIPHPTNQNHNGGTIAFGPDGYLYLGTGDGGGGNDPDNNAQNLESLLGKFLRLDINTPLTQTPAYNIPTKGGNYGWRVWEGSRCTGLGPAACNMAGYVFPVYEYSSAPGESRCSVTGGNVYRGRQRAVPIGAYIYADYCTGEIFQFLNGQNTRLTDTNRFISSFGEDENGELYFTGLFSGTVDRILGKRPANSDFDGDLSTDLAVFRPSNGTWYVRNSSNGNFFSRNFGISGDVPVAEDYDGDGQTDIAVYRPSTSTFYYLASGQASYNIVPFGNPGDVPAPADYDGDGMADLAVFRASASTWYVRRSASGQTLTKSWGIVNDVPVPGDYDGDGYHDIAVWRPSDGFWYVSLSSNGQFLAVRYGVSGDIPNPGDFDGDGTSDFGIYRPSTGQWFIRLANGGFKFAVWGIADDVPVVGDYDGDGSDDIAVWRPSSGIWYVIGTSSGQVYYPAWGVPGDLPIPRYDVP
ncbi:MAG: PQQ-dependent sugar dehydrogenase [Acidobacteria bacterium]|nr:PQQ-dependent sugar dehydrogenase [Acidobacteriota bacterium]